MGFIWFYCIFINKYFGSEDKCEKFCTIFDKLRKKVSSITSLHLILVHKMLKIMYHKLEINFFVSFAIEFSTKSTLSKIPHDLNGESP